MGILQKELTRAQREGKSVGVILVDIDHFKKINDTQGHSAGDRCLSRAAQRMKSAVRSYDSVGRYGGEEFLIVLPGCTSRMAVERAEQIRLMLGEPGPDASESQITVSMGVAADMAQQSMARQRWKNCYPGLMTRSIKPSAMDGIASWLSRGNTFSTDNRTSKVN